MTIVTMTVLGLHTAKPNLLLMKQENKGYTTELKTDISFMRDQFKICTWLGEMEYIMDDIKFFSLKEVLIEGITHEIDEGEVSRDEMSAYFDDLFITINELLAT